MDITDSGDRLGHLLRMVRQTAGQPDPDRMLAELAEAIRSTDGLPDRVEVHPDTDDPDDTIRAVMEARRPRVVRSASGEETLLVPIEANGQVPVVLSLVQGAFSPEDRTLWEILSAHVGNALYAHRKGEKIRRITDICRRVFGAGVLSDALRIAVRSVVEEYGYYCACVALVTEDGKFLVHEAHYARADLSVEPGYRQRIGQGLVGRAARSRSTICVNDTSSSDDYVPVIPDVKSELCIPLMAGDRLVGVLDVNARVTSAFDGEDIRLMETLAGQLALVMEKARHLERIAQARSRLVQGEKLRAIGQLVSGVAHELNNPLTGVIGYSQLLTAEECSEKVRKGLEKVYSEATRCHRIIQNLQTFARDNAPEKRPVNLNEIIESTFELRSYPLRADGIRVTMDLAADLPPIEGDFQQLQQVFLNILINAHQAIKSSGREGRLTVRSENAGDSVRTVVLDNGPGIPPDALQRIFDPFFTTLPAGHGTGLGLSICYGIVEEHGGVISATSTPGQGAAIMIELPAVGSR